MDSNVNFITFHPLSVQYNGSLYPLSQEAINEIKDATKQGLRLMIVGALFAFFKTSYQLRNKLFQDLTSRDKTLNKQENTITKTHSLFLKNASPLPIKTTEKDVTNNSKVSSSQENSSKKSNDYNNPYSLKSHEEEEVEKGFDELSKMAKDSNVSFPYNTSIKKFQESLFRMKNHVNRFQAARLNKYFIEAMKAKTPLYSFTNLVQNDPNLLNPQWTINKCSILIENLRDAIPTHNIFNPAQETENQKVLANIKEHLEKIKSSSSAATQFQNAKRDYESGLTKMDAYLRPDQKSQLLLYFVEAMKENNPQLALENFLIAEARKANGRWTEKKLYHLILHLKEAMPTSNAFLTPQVDPDVKKIQGIASKDRFVAFYKDGPTRFFGNFAECPITITINQQKYRFKCAEAAFQWMKYKHSNDHRLVKFFTCDGEEAFKLSRELGNEIQCPNWVKGQRDDAMWLILNAKFSQHPKFMEYLKATGNAYLLEHNKKTLVDTYWSDNKDGRGVNMLGKMLMAIRDGQPKPTPVPTDKIEGKSFFASKQDDEVQKWAKKANNGLDYITCV